MNKLSKLKQVSLREAWKHEAHDFTNWMAEEDNLAELSNEIGIDISLIQTEAAVGSFSVDILGEESNTGHKIIIENQLEVTNHDHLGKIITYASGHDARFIIWVVKDVREEHRQAVDWLNDHTDDGIEFFLIRIELWQIDDSAFAPKFEVVSRPNDWARAVRESTGSSKLTETKVKQLEFWTRFKEFANEQETTLRFRKLYAQHWTNISIGHSELSMALTINTRDNQFGVEIYVPDNKDLYSKLHEQKDAIEADLGDVGTVEWMGLPEKKACRIKAVYSGDFNDDAQWENHFAWLLTTAEKFQQVFPKYWG